MARLRIRVELNRRVAGVPLDKMASVVEETRKFFYLLSEDVHIEAGRGEWLASDFDAESLNFTAEYSGPVSIEQAKAFGAAFSGATSLRKVTIAQFTRIAEFLGEDELVGFGLYQSDQETEPGEWRCLSKRDALRFGEEIKLLAAAAGEQSETQLPAVMTGSVAGRRLFRDRREEGRRDREVMAADPSKVLRELESNLVRRIGLLEDELAQQNRRMQQMQGSSEITEERFQKLLTAMETFWSQAPRQVPLLAAPAAVEPVAPAPAPAQVSASLIEAPKPAEAETPKPEAVEPPAAPRVEAPAPEPRLQPQFNSPRPKPRRWSLAGVCLAAGMAILAGFAYPDIQHWTRLTHVETMPVVKPKAPAPPDLALLAEASAPAASPEAPAAKHVTAKSEPFIGPLIPLDIPAKIKSRIQSEVRVDVVVAIDPEGNVTEARVSSTKGERAELLVSEALRAARESRFRPAREGDKTIESQMVLTFLFKPQSADF
jgi:TonB family protein